MTEWRTVPATPGDVATFMAAQLGCVWRREVVEGPAVGYDEGRALHFVEATFAG